MGQLTKVLVENHERHIRVLNNDLNNLYAQDKQQGTNSRETAGQILADIQKHRELIKTLQAGKQT